MCCRSLGISLLLGLLAATAGSLCFGAEPPTPAATTTTAPTAPTWPQWRGPQRDGLAPAGPAWPESLKPEHLKVLWRAELGPSYSGPIVASDRVLVTETQNQKEEVVRALDRQSGRELWKASWSGALSVAFMAKRNGDWIRATPAYDGQSLFVAGMRDVLVALDAATGQERWRVDFAAKYKTPLPSFGFVSSPLVVGPHLFVQAGGGVCKLDKATGQVLWRVLEDQGGMYGNAFSSPVVLKLAGTEQLVVQTRQKLAGLDLETGKVLWSQAVPASMAMNILTPAQFEQSLFTSAYGAGSYLFSISRTGADWQVQTLWHKPVQGYMGSPVIIDGHAYLHLRNRRLACLDLATGDTKWSSEPYGEYASLVAQDHKILALDQRGELLLFRASPEKFYLLDSRKVSEQETWAHLAVCGSEVYVRDLKGLTVYHWK